MELSSRALLSSLVAFDTISSRGNIELIEWVADYLSNLGVRSDCWRNPAGDKANLFATIGPAERGGVCLHGHTDVVPVAGQPWTSDPFRLSERDGLLFGRGTSDMKAWIACTLAAVPRYCSKRLLTPIHIALSYDEEIGCLGAPHMIAAFGRSVPKPRIAFIGEPSWMAPITAHKGVIALDTNITGRAAHASLLHLGVSAITAAAEMAAEIHAIAQEWMMRPGPFGMQPSGPSLSVGQLSGGIARNVIAGEAKLAWELRFRADDSPEQLLSDVLARVQLRLRRTFKQAFDALRLETRELARVPAFDAGSNGPAELLARRLGATGEARAVPYGAEAGQYAAAGVSTIICGPGSIEQAHQPDEFIARSQLAACDEFLARLGEWAAHQSLAAES